MDRRLENEMARDESHAADIRARQEDAFKASKNNESVQTSHQPITDQNTETFLNEAMKNGLDLRKIAQEVAEKNAAEAKNKESDS